MGGILILDDESSVRGFFRAVLEAAGYSVEEASTARDAFQILRERRMDLVMTDILMPDMDGLEVTRTLRREFPGVKIIAVSGAQQDIDYRTVARFLGADDTLLKPVTVRDLQDAVVRLLGRPAEPPSD